MSQNWDYESFKVKLSNVARKTILWQEFLKWIYSIDHSVLECS